MPRRRFLLLLLAALLAQACRGGGPELVLIVTVDTLRADRLGAHGSTLGLSPRLDRLAAESTVFEYAYAPASFTLPSLAALMTGRYPEEVGIAANSTILSKEAPNLAGWFRSRGWRTGAVVSNYVLRPESGFDAGFEHYDATFPQREVVRPVPERVGRDTTAAALRLLDALRQRRQPVFLWVHYQDPHGPYAPPAGFRERYLAVEERASDAARTLPVSRTQSGFGAIPRYQYIEGSTRPAFYRAGYDGEVAYVDAAIGELLDGVRGRGLWSRAVVVFTADHGEGLGEDDYWFAHGELLTDPLVRVPLFLRVPGRPGGRRGEVAGLLDAFPTLAALFGGAAPPGCRGRDLLAPGAERRPSEMYMTTLRVSPTPRAGVVAWDHKYLIAIEQGGFREQLFRLGDEARDLATVQPNLLRGLRARLLEVRRTLRVVGAREQPLSPEDEEAFRALGYLGG